jgi:hypothetical protein
MIRTSSSTPSPLLRTENDLSCKAESRNLDQYKVEKLFERTHVCNVRDKGVVRIGIR